MAGEFEKPLTMGANLPNGFFSDEKGAGFNLSTYDGRLSIKFWKAGEKSSDNRDNTLSLNIGQVMIFNNMLKYLITTRHAAYSAGGAEAYADITNLYMNIDGMMNGQPMIFGTIRFDTVEIEGIKRLKLTVTRNTTINSVVLCDRFLKNALPSDSPFRPQYDVLDTSFLRLCTEINSYCVSSWMFAAFNKLYGAVVKPNSGGGKSGGNGGYQQKSYNNGGGNSTSSRGGNTDRDYQSPIFDDSADF
jgi:hypothetical protein